ncbi:MAG: RHS repeat-associated core domain-containing protein, partial [Gemmatimonadota bacterium]
AEPPAWFGTLLEDKRDHAGTSFRRNRAYDPTTGRFTQEDPIGLAGGLNLYGYAGGDPVNFSDPFGLCPQWLTGRPCSGGVDLGASFLPGVSSGIDAATLLSGQNPLTGEDVGVVGRGIALTGLITPAGGGQIRAAGKTISRVTGDFVNRVIGRGVKNEQILDALRNPLKVKGVVLDAQGRPSQQIIGREATVVQNPETGDLVTTWRTSGRLRKRLEPPPE